jgi:hypothetical protein
MPYGTDRPAENPARRQPIGAGRAGSSLAVIELIRMAGFWRSMTTLPDGGLYRDELVGREHRCSAFRLPRQSCVCSVLESAAAGRVPSGTDQAPAAEWPRHWLQATYNPILDSLGQVTKVVKFASDVTGGQRSGWPKGDDRCQTNVDGRLEFNVDGTIPARQRQFPACGRLSRRPRSLAAITG